MSQFLPDEKPTPENTKGPEAYLSGEERKELQRMLSFPEDLPPKFKSWLIDFIAVNLPQIPVSQIVGYQKGSQSSRVSITSSQSIPNDTVTTIQWSTVDFDFGSLFSASANTRLTISTAGKYIAGAQVTWATGGGARSLQLFVNDVEQALNQIAAVGGFQTAHTVTTLVDLNPGDYIDVRVYQNSGANLNVDGTARRTHFWCARVGT